TDDAAVKQAIAGEVECVDLDLGVLTRVHEADVSVRDHHLRLKNGVCWHDDRQLLCRCDNAAHRVHHKLLNDAVNWCGEILKLGSLLRFSQIVSKTACLAFRFSEFTEESPMELRIGLRARFGND